MTLGRGRHSAHARQQCGSRCGRKSPPPEASPRPTGRRHVAPTLASSNPRPPRVPLASQRRPGPGRPIRGPPRAGSGPSAPRLPLPIWIEGRSPSIPSSPSTRRRPSSASPRRKAVASPEPRSVVARAPRRYAASPSPLGVSPPPAVANPLCCHGTPPESPSLSVGPPSSQIRPRLGLRHPSPASPVPPGVLPAFAQPRGEPSPPPPCPLGSEQRSRSLPGAR